MANAEFLKHWSGQQRAELDALLLKRVAELEQLGDVVNTVDWIIELAGGTPSTETRRIALLSAIVIATTEL